MSILYLITARAGSKGLPNKNKKLLNGKPLIFYTMEFAIQNAKSNDVICVSTDDHEIVEIIKKNYNFEVPFIRPSELSDDSASIFDVITHAIKHYNQKSINFEHILLLQPTSPLRIKDDFENIYNIYKKTFASMVVSVKLSKANPYFNLFEENDDKLLVKIKPNTKFKNRQECPPVYLYNGSLYLVKTDQFLKKLNFDFDNIVKYEMPESRSIDIDTQSDWILAEYYLNKFNENN